MSSGLSQIDGSAPLIGTTTALFKLTNADMTSTADQAFRQLFPFTTYAITQIQVTQASGSLSGAIGGIYGAANKSAPILVAATQVYSGVTAVDSVFPLTLATAAGKLLTVQTLFLSLTTGLGAAGTASFYVMGTALA